MAVAYDNGSRAEGNFVSSLSSGAFTISGADRVMVIAVMIQDVAINTPTASTGSPAAITGASAGSAQNRRTALYQVTAPATGSQSATAQFSNADGSNIVCVAASFTGADQTTPCQDGNSATATSATPSVTVANTTADDFVIDSCHHGGLGPGASGSPGANQTQIGTLSEGFGGVSRQDGADGGVMSWSSAESLLYATVACRIVASAGAPGPDLSASPGEPVVTRSLF